jgi:hypothetical protein
MRAVTLHRYTLLLAAAAVLMTSGCAQRSLYIPVSQNTPLFDSSRQIKACAYIGTNHIELQAAYNPYPHIATAANINFGGGIAIYDIALGGYGYNRKQNLRYELFAGYGYNSNIVFPATYTSIFTKERVDYEVNSLYNKYYLQPSIGYFGRINMYKLNCSFALSARASYLNFKRFLYREIDVARTTDPDLPVYSFSRSYRNKKLFLLEPCFTNKVGMRNLYGIIQVQAIIPYSEEIDLRYTKFSPGILFSLGVQYNFPFGDR